MKSKNDSLKFLQKLVDQKFSEKERRYPKHEKRYSEYFLKNPDRTDKDQDQWFIYVPTYFNDCLDIAKTERRVETGRKIKDKKTGKMKDEKETRKVWTQGSRFNFHRGCTLYDTPKAYLRWRYAIREIKYCISIKSAKAAKPAIDKTERDHGKVIFSILSPRPQTNSLEEIGEFKRTQDEFVRFLIEGDPEIISE